ncbi:MotE family protein [Halanaerobium praevalens]|uniref:MgtE intracellular region n=1 Tax=Halanaerobium praevalens (strain ATCC 33744 / DSM 2228 / GSL) TaxID=572479 RepID=E3DPM7_HALPG|nr:MgtE integral membrane protein [Halanaerobium praevalens]ADO76702.1 MgtE intracellular region [Halanaerobium praevalens DSM 2228]
MIKKILFFLMIFLILFAMLTWSFNALGIIDVKTTVSNLANSTPVVKDYIITQTELDSLKDENSNLEKTINEKDSEILELESEIEKANKKLAAKDQAISDLETDYKNLNTEIDDREAKLDKVANIYTKMEPAAAAAVIQELNANLAVEVLSRLKDEQAAEILESLPQQEAARFISQLGLE